jgi:hypothetical protein
MASEGTNSSTLTRLQDLSKTRIMPSRLAPTVHKYPDVLEFSLTKANRLQKASPSGLESVDNQRRATRVVYLLKRTIDGYVRDCARRKSDYMSTFKTSRRCV